MARHPWQYVREAWKKTELLCNDRDFLQVWIETIREAGQSGVLTREDFCEHGIKDGDWCPECNAAYKEARIENGDEETEGLEGV